MKTKWKHCLHVVISFILLISLCAIPVFAAEGSPFTDVKSGAYYEQAVAWAVENEITSGTSATTFGPNEGCTRGQVVTFLWRAAGRPEPASSSNPFKDVSITAYYGKAVLWAAEKGITQGTSATAFSPGQVCTRGQIVTFLYRFEGSPEVGEVENKFQDLKAGAYYEKAVLWAVSCGVTSGKSETSFAPNETCLRGQVVTFLFRDMTNKTPPLVDPPADAVKVRNVKEYDEAREKGAKEIVSDADPFIVGAHESLAVPDDVSFYVPGTLRIEAQGELVNDGTLKAEKLVMTAMEKPDQMPEDNNVRAHLGNRGTAVIGAITMEDCGWEEVNSDGENQWFETFGPNILNGWNPWDRDEEGKPIAYDNRGVSLTVAGDFYEGSGAYVNNSDGAKLTVAGSTQIAVFGNMENHGSASYGDMLLMAGPRPEELLDNIGYNSRFVNYGDVTMKNVTLDGCTWGIERSDEFNTWMDYPGSPEFRNGAWEGETYGDDRALDNKDAVMTVTGKLTAGIGAEVNLLPETTTKLSGNVALSSGRVRTGGMVSFSGNVEISDDGGIEPDWESSGAEVTFDGDVILKAGRFTAFEAGPWHIGYHSEGGARIENGYGNKMTFNGAVTVEKYSRVENEGRMYMNGSYDASDFENLAQGYLLLEGEAVTESPYKEWNDEWGDRHEEGGKIYVWVGNMVGSAALENVGTLVMDCDAEAYEINNNVRPPEEGREAVRGDLTVTAGHTLTIRSEFINSGFFLGEEYLAASVKIASGAAVSVNPGDKGGLAAIRNWGRFVLDGRADLSACGEIQNGGNPGEPAEMEINGNVEAVTVMIGEDNGHKYLDEFPTIRNNGSMNISGSVNFRGFAFENVGGSLTIEKGGALKLLNNPEMVANTILANSGKLTVRGQLLLEETGMIVFYQDPWTEIVIDGGEVINKGSVFISCHDEEDGSIPLPMTGGIGGNVVTIAVVTSETAARAAEEMGFNVIEMEEGASITFTSDFTTAAQVSVIGGSLTVKAGVTLTVGPYMGVDMPGELHLEEGARICLVSENPEDMDFWADLGSFNVSEPEQKDGRYVITVTAG